MSRYFPLSSDRFEHHFGIRALTDAESIVEATDHYAAELELKRDLIAKHEPYYYRALPGSELAQQEVFDLLCSSASFLADGTNSLTGETVDIDRRSPLLSIARHVQEDLAILRGDSKTGFPLIAGVICFPSGWCIQDKLGESLLSIHAPVPEFASKLSTATDRLMQYLKPNRPVWRMNWGVRPCDQLDQSPIHAEFLAQQRDRITADNAGRECFFRVERQTLARLPQSGDVLFAIHTHQCPLEQLESDHKKRLLGVLESCPDETLAYKGILPMRSPIIEYLRETT